MLESHHTNRTLSSMKTIRTMKLFTGFGALATISALHFKWAAKSLSAGTGRQDLETAHTYRRDLLGSIFVIAPRF
jgi:hypothetical protein